MLGPTLEGVSIMSCNDGKWNNKRPTCRAPCSDPGLLQNGTRTGNDFRHKKQVKYSCNIGTKLVGQKTMQCNDGNWNYKKPSCKVVNCGRLKTPSNGKKIKETKTTYLGRTVFTCNKGFRLKGSSVRVCEANGQWSGITTTCEPVQCRDPGMPIHGLRTPNKRKYVYQDRVRFTCKASFTRIGKSEITCQYDGQWNGYKVFCLAPCRDPGIPKYGNRFDNNFKNGQTVRFGCKSGRPMTGSPVITCHNGRWSNSAPSCYQRCANNLVLIRSNGPTANPPLTRGQSTKHGTTITFNCRDRYALVGKQTIRCEDGRWSSTLIPVCKAPCSDPGSLSHGQKTGSSYSHGDQVTYSCLKNYTLVGSSRMTCDNGRWDRSKPSCKAITMTIKKSSGCGDHYKSSPHKVSGEIMSPGYPGNYANNKQCHWKISSNTRIGLHFKTFETESTHDSVSIYDGGSSSAPPLGVYSGSTLPPFTTSSSNQLYVTFTTDGSVTKKGFAMKYQDSPVNSTVESTHWRATN